MGGWRGGREPQETPHRNDEGGDEVMRRNAFDHGVCRAWNSLS